MVSAQMAAVLATLGRRPVERLDRVTAEAAAAALGVDGITAGVGTGATGTVLAWGTEAVSAAVDHLQFTLGEGPGTDCAASGLPVLAPDLAAAEGRWPAFVPAASALGVRAVFAFPLRIGAMSVGTMLAHRMLAGPLADGQLTDAFALAGAVTIVLVDLRSAKDLRPGDGPPVGWGAGVTYRAEVHQATGMISVQLGVPLAEALVRLRAYAYGQDRLIADVAADVVSRRLRFDSL